MIYGKNTPPEMGGNEVRVVSAAPDTYGETVAGEAGSTGGAVDVGLRGVPDSLSFNYGVLIGGILTQLIADAEARLGEMRDCVDWYQREVQKCEQRLADLQRLSAAARNEAD